ncbi:hypothetical protein TNCV_3071051 [Trichonephila clavipes]|nr:hypothetical protein TNCV_3071051 [Trichonephila clavipes]
MLNISLPITIIALKNSISPHKRALVTSIAVSERNGTEFTNIVIPGFHSMHEIDVWPDIEVTRLSGGYSFVGSLMASEQRRIYEFLTDLMVMKAVSSKIVEESIQNVSFEFTSHQINTNNIVVVTNATCLTKSGRYPRNSSQLRARTCDGLTRLFFKSSQCQYDFARFHMSFKGKYSGGGQRQPTYLPLPPISLEHLRLDGYLEYPHTAKGTMHLQTAMLSPGFEPRAYGIADSGP